MREMKPIGPKVRRQNRTEQLEQLCTKQQVAEGAEHFPLFHDQHTMQEVLVPLGSKEPDGSSREPHSTSLHPWTKGFAMWKLKINFQPVNQVESRRILAKRPIIRKPHTTGELTVSLKDQQLVPAEVLPSDVGSKMTEPT